MGLNPCSQLSVLSSQFEYPMPPMAGKTRHSRGKENWLQLVVRTISGSRKDLIRRRAGHGVAVLVDLHAQAQTHGGKNFLDLVQRLAAEILGLQHLGFGLLYEFSDGLNIRVLQAVVAAHRELELFHGTV